MLTKHAINGEHSLPFFNTPDTKLLAENRSTNRQKLSHWRDAILTALKMKYLPTGIGEMTGGIKVASIAVTDYGIWAARARNVVSKSKKLNDDEKLNIYEKLAEALAKKRYPHYITDI